MHPTLKETGEGILFQNILYKRECMHLAQIDPYYTYVNINQYLTKDGLDIRVNEDKMLFLPDMFGTEKHIRNLNSDYAIEEKLKTMKGVLVDESIPAHLIFSVDEDSGFVEDYGRGFLIWVAGELKFQPALSELREVLLHDTDGELREEALKSISKLGGRRATSALCEKLSQRHEYEDIRERAAHALYEIPFPESVNPLVQAYEETALDKPKTIDESFDVHQGTWIPISCLRALGQIPTVAALKGIKRGLGNPYREIEHSARISLGEWIEKNAHMIKKGFFEDRAAERINLLKKLILQYGIDEQKEFYDEWRI